MVRVRLPIWYLFRRGGWEVSWAVRFGIVLSAKVVGDESAGSSLYLDVQVYGGTNICLACRDACALANKLGITVWFGFSEKKLHANPDTDWQRLVAGWYKARADNQQWVRPI